MGIIDKALQKQREQQQSLPPTIDDSETVGLNAEPVQPADGQAKPEPLPKPDSSERPRASRKSDVIHLDEATLRAHGVMLNDGRRDPIKEEFRYIKRHLLHNAFSHAGELAENANLVMVTSANPNEGKSFTAINLAMSIALEQDRTVLLIDADVVKPSISNFLNIAPRQGLVDYLLGEVEDVGKVIHTTSVPRLNLILAGQQHHLTNELMSSDRMRALVNELGSRYPDRIILFDSPPMLGVSEAHSLARQMGQTVFVVEYGKTPQKDVLESLPLLNPEAAVGFVLNRSKGGIKRHYAYGYYGKGR